MKNIEIIYEIKHHLGNVLSTIFCNYDFFIFYGKLLKYPLGLDLTTSPPPCSYNGRSC